MQCAETGRGARVARLAVAALVASIAVGVASPATAASIFWEDFEGYSSFCGSCGDPTNPGLPLMSEGANEFWYGGRFEFFDNGTIDQDLAVQQFGGGTNNSHTGRMEDEAGMILHLDAGYTNVQLDFDWRLFSGGRVDRLVVGYFIGDLGFDTGPNRRRDFFTDDFGGNQTDAVMWWQNEWTELLRGNSNDWQPESFALPDNTEMWIAFWLDNGEHDFGKIDNIHITGDAIPEPSALGLLGLALAGLWLKRR